MPPQFVAIKNIEKYQHYKHRNPPWVKLHYSILDDPAFLALDEVQQCRYIKLIMLASRQLNCISTSPEYLARVMRISEQVDLTPLINAGFLIASRKRQSSKMLVPPHENRSQSRVEKSRVEKRKDNTSLSDERVLAASNGNVPEWGTPEALVALYNTETPDECPAITKLTDARKKKARLYLQQFPDKDFWQTVCRRIHQSVFLRGFKTSLGHEHFKASLDWLLTKGKDGTENVVKVFEGRYSNG